MKQLLLIGLLIGASATAKAQYSFGKGSCVLRDGQQLTGSMRLNFPTAQTASALRYYDGKQEQEFTPDLVRSCMLGKHGFIVGRNFVAPDDHGGIPVDQDFVEVADTTGNVQVFYYSYEAYVDPSWTGGAPAMAAGGQMVGGMGHVGGYAKKRILLLRKAGTQQLVPYTAGARKSIFNPDSKTPADNDVAATVAFFSDDPALQDLILKGKLPDSQLLTTVRAYNSGAKKSIR